MKGSFIAGCCAAVLFAGCREFSAPVAPSAVPGETSLTAAATASVPFKGSLEGQYGTSTGTFPLISESIVATGHATSFGRYTLEVEETVNLLNATAIGTFTFTAANGDTLHGSYTGQAQLGPVLTIVEEATVLGGTGRFAGAGGSFTINRTFDPATRTTTGSFDGTISR